MVPTTTFRTFGNSNLHKCGVICENVPFGGKTVYVILISWFHPFVVLFMVKTAQGAIEVFFVDAYERKLS